MNLHCCAMEEACRPFVRLRKKKATIRFWAFNQLGQLQPNTMPEDQSSHYRVQTQVQYCSGLMDEPSEATADGAPSIFFSASIHRLLTSLVARFLSSPRPDTQIAEPSRASGQRRSAWWSRMGSQLILLKTLILMMLQLMVTVGDAQFRIAAGLGKD